MILFYDMAANLILVLALATKTFRRLNNKFESVENVPFISQKYFWFVLVRKKKGGFIQKLPYPTLIENILLINQANLGVRRLSIGLLKGGDVKKEVNYFFFKGL